MGIACMCEPRYAPAMSEPAGPDQDLDHQGVDWSVYEFEEEFSEDAVHPVGKDDRTKMPEDEGDAVGPYGNEGSLEGDG
jgi:hypothetical protein